VKKWTQQAVFRPSGNLVVLSPLWYYLVYGMMSIGACTVQLFSRWNVFIKTKIYFRLHVFCELNEQIEHFWIYSFWKLNICTKVFNTVHFKAHFGPYHTKRRAVVDWLCDWRCAWVYIGTGLSKGCTKSLRAYFHFIPECHLLGWGQQRNRPQIPYIYCSPFKYNSYNLNMSIQTRKIEMNKGTVKWWNLYIPMCQYS